VKTTLTPPGELHDGCWIDPSAFVATGRGWSALRHRGRDLGAGRRARRTADILGERAHRGGARVEGAVLWERVEVGEGSVLRDCVIGADVRIGADVDIAPGVILESGAVVPDHTRWRRPPVTRAAHSAFRDARLTRSSVLD